MNSIRVFEAFAGVGCQHQALKNINVDFEIVGISEIDKFAIKTYEALHGKVNNYGDISKIEPSELPDFDLFTYSFPCQDISIAGYRLGLEKGSNTRSSLLWECEKVIKEKKPKYLLMENVKNLIGKNNRPHFQKWLELLEDMGYTNYWQVINAKDFGVPQNRERVFCVSIRGKHKPFSFNYQCQNKKVLKDFLDTSYENKYFVSPCFVHHIEFDDINKKQVGIINKKGLYDVEKRIYGVYDNYTSVITRARNHIYQPIKYVTEDVRTEWLAYIGKYFDMSDEKNEIIKNGVVRRITERESWKLMGFEEDEIKKAFSIGNSKTQLYKQAGNGIVIPILEYIFKTMLLT